MSFGGTFVATTNSAGKAAGLASRADSRPRHRRGLLRLLLGGKHESGCLLVAPEQGELALLVRDFSLGLGERVLRGPELGLDRCRVADAVETALFARGIAALLELG